MTASPHHPTPLRRFLAIVATGVRATFLQPARLAPRDTDWGPMVAMLALALALQFGADWAWVGPQGEVAWTGVADVLLVLPVVLLFAAVAARIAGQPDRVPHLMTVALAIALVFAAAGHVLRAAMAYRWAETGYSPPINDALSWTFLVWFSLACAVAAVRIFGPSRPRCAGIVLAAFVCLGVPFAVIAPAPVLWAALPGQGEEQAGRHVSEEALYLQPALLERELAGVAPGREGPPELFVLVVAGDAGQDVFMKEADYVTRLFEDRFGAAGHTVALINNPQSASDTPMASVTSMQRALDHFGALMDPAKDILFLYLTSHGSPDHRFALQFGGMQFKDLDPPRLREMLDRSGIRRRVIVVSACYSGGFVDALKGDDTLVITAAAADRSSFGCSNEAEFTYFGKAYFEEALHKTGSFTGAFELARASIAARESDEQVEPSKPQMFVGARIKAALDEFEKGRAERKGGSI